MITSQPWIQSRRCSLFPTKVRHRIASNFNITKHPNRSTWRDHFNILPKQIWKSSRHNKVVRIISCHVMGNNRTWLRWFAPQEHSSGAAAKLRAISFLVTDLTTLEAFRSIRAIFRILPGLPTTEASRHLCRTLTKPHGASAESATLCRHHRASYRNESYTFIFGHVAQVSELVFQEEPARMVTALAFRRPALRMLMPPNRRLDFCLGMNRPLTARYFLSAFRLAK